MSHLTNSGIGAIGMIPWGSHFCQFYDTAEDLVDTLVPYFKAGLEGNEQCLWVTAPPFNATEAEAALRNAVPDADARIRKGQIEIIDHKEWYTRSGTMTAEEVIDGWIQRKESAINSGYDGFRLTGNLYFLTPDDWDSFAQYESKVNDCFCDHRLIALCSYCLSKSSAGNVMDVVQNHEFALARRHGDWALIENGSLKRAKEELRRANEELELRVEERTADLTAALGELQRTTDSLRRALADKDVLLREVHHRVKNNLQVITSLLTLKALRSSDLSLKEAFKDTLRRITAMSLVHEALYQHESTSEIDFSRYLQALVDAMVESFNATDRVSVDFQVEEARIHLDTAVPLGLIAVEAISNALKHGFSHGQDGKISVFFRPARIGKEGELVVRDNGVGPAQVMTKGSGLNLIKAIGRQVDGNVTLERMDGWTEFRLSFAGSMLTVV
ncbi:MEDS domain-containing protein [Telmatospirillum sp. J64-1]|uniref:MEDS domain-containing protein n=1 Tax=Telmatospirillum sp. J64-1 TaxID=2502183 RepID=UPI00115CF6F5|nr:MEDS domain-containing protein [Telmatospirillum sp. J64-1]